MINALVWYCQGLGVTSPVISLAGGTIVKWEAGAIAQPTPAEMQTIETNYLASKEYAVSVFSTPVAVKRIYEVFVNDIFRLEPRFATVQALLVDKTFDGLKLYLQGAIVGNLITQDDYDDFSDILLEQNIDLDDF